MLLHKWHWEVLQHPQYSPVMNPCDSFPWIEEPLRGIRFPDIPSEFRAIGNHGRLARWIKWRACDIGKAKEGLENELWRRWSTGRVGEWAELIPQPFHHFTYITTNSPILPSLYLCHSSFSNPSIASPTSQFILQPFFCFSYVTSSSLKSPGKPPMEPDP